MKMKRFLVLYFVVIMFLVGCAATRTGWSKSGASNKQSKRDFAECEKASPGKGAGRFARGMKQTPQQGDIDKCMRGKGYQPTM
jgi:hypothetical protein